MRRMTARYRVVTPLFLAADPKDDPELRAPSLKGVLRFWYRATALPGLGSWEEVRRREAELFGGAGRGQGQAAFLLTLRQGHAAEIVKSGGKSDFSHAAYLGYGVVDTVKQVNTRGFIKPGTVFEADFLFKPGAREEQVRGLKTACVALGLFGGLGARSRHGFGSLCLESLQVDGAEQWRCPREPESLAEAIESFLKGLGVMSPDLPAYSAFSHDSRVVVLGTPADDPMRLLDGIGLEMMLYRSYGKGGKEGKHWVVGKHEARQVFADDHDLIVDFIKTGRIARHPRRVAFGLPHNYYFSSDKSKVDVKPAGTDHQTRDAGRRASPLFIHVQPVGQRYTAVFTLLSAAFLPGDRKVVIEGKGKGAARGAVPVDPGLTGYKVIRDFLDLFPGRLEVTI